MCKSAAHLQGVRLAYRGCCRRARSEYGEGPVFVQLSRAVPYSIGKISSLEILKANNVYGW
jgi:hypothetical protein